MATGVVDSPGKIGSFIPCLDEVIAEGMVVREKVEVPVYRHGAMQVTQINSGDYGRK